ncbi:hypothetical protein D3C72_1971260 [compost metagenome]
MILPAPRAIMCRATGWLTLNTEVRLVDMTWSNFSGGKASRLERNCMPALLTRMSIGPSWSSI